MLPSTVLNREVIVYIFQAPYKCYFYERKWHGASQLFCYYYWFIFDFLVLYVYIYQLAVFKFVLVNCFKNIFSINRIELTFYFLSMHHVCTTVCLTFNILYIIYMYMNCCISSNLHCMYVITWKSITCVLWIYLQIF